MLTGRTGQFNKNKIYRLVKKWRSELFSGINFAVRFIFGPTCSRNIPEGKNILHFFVQSARLQRHVFLSFLSISFCSFPCAREITLTRHTHFPFHAMQIKHVHVTPRDQQSEAVHENFFVLLSCTSQVPHFLSCLPLMKLHGRRDIQRQSRCSGSIMCRAARPVSSVASSDNYQDLAIEIVFLKDWRVLAELKKNQSFLCCLEKKKMEVERQGIEKKKTASSTHPLSTFTLFLYLVSGNPTPPPPLLHPALRTHTSAQAVVGSLAVGVRAWPVRLV